MENYIKELKSGEIIVHKNLGVTHITVAMRCDGREIEKERNLNKINIY